VFLEPVPGANGVLVPPPEYWPKVREACDRHGALLVADEVLTGFGRTGRWFGHQHFEAVPDLITVSKGLTGGYGVLGAVLVHERVSAHFDDAVLLSGLTQYAHPLGVAASLEALRVYEEEGLIDRAADLGERVLGPELETLKARVGAPFVRSLGLLGAIELPATDPARLARALAAERIHAFVRSRERTLVLAPPLCIEEADLRDGLARIGDAIEAAA
jgi:taurine--2-oxoglutarate transaminase